MAAQQTTRTAEEQSAFDWFAGRYDRPGEQWAQEHVTGVSTNHAPDTISIRLNDRLVKEIFLQPDTHFGWRIVGTFLQDGNHPGYLS